MRGVYEELLRDATHVYAGPTEIEIFSDGDTRPTIGRET